MLRAWGEKDEKGEGYFIFGFIEAFSKGGEWETVRAKDGFSPSIMDNIEVWNSVGESSVTGM